MRDHNLILVRSDQGDGGWSLHAPGVTDKEIAQGDAPPLLSGTATQDDQGEWDRPDSTDYARAWTVYRARS